MTNTRGKATKRFTDEERAAMRERAQEQKVATRRGGRAGKADGESDVQNEVRDARLQRQGEPRRGRQVAGRFRA